MVRRKIKELKISPWIVDGFNGILGFVIYNFLLYLLKIAGIKGIIGRIVNETGYFYLNTFVDFGLPKISLVSIVIFSFGFAFLLGIGIAKLVRKFRKCYKCV